MEGNCMRRIIIFRFFLIVVLTIIAVLDFANVITFYSQPAVRFSITSGAILMLIYKVFEADEKNHHYS